MKSHNEKGADTLRSLIKVVSEKILEKEEQSKRFPIINDIENYKGFQTSIGITNDELSNHDFLPFLFECLEFDSWENRLELESAMSPSKEYKLDEQCIIATLKNVNFNKDDNLLEFYSKDIGTVINFYIVFKSDFFKFLGEIVFQGEDPIGTGDLSYSHFKEDGELDPKVFDSYKTAYNNHLRK